jgi:glycosyltransferase involved in cell wall biosynthesis
MRIARIMTRLNLGGPARQVLASDPLLRSWGFEVRLFVGSPEPGEGELLETARELGLDVVTVPGLGRSPRLDRDLSAWRFLRRELRRFDPQVIHTHASKAGFLGRLAARAAPRARLVHSFHGHVLEGYFSAPISALLQASERWLARRTARVIAVSEATRQDLLRLRVVAPGQVELVPPGLRLEALAALAALEFSESAETSEPAEPKELLEPPETAPSAERLGRASALSPGPIGQPELQGNAWGLIPAPSATDAPTDSALRPRQRATLGLRPEQPLVLLMGRLAEVKRPLLALAAFRSAEERRTKGQPAAHLVVVGDGQLCPALEAARSALPAELRGRIHLAGAVGDPLPWYAAADVVLLASRNEGLPVALIEAGAAARPVVATNVGGVGELIEPGWNGLLAPGGPAEAAQEGLVEGLRRLLDQPAERRRLGLNGRQRALERHSALALARALARLYQGVLGKVEMPDLLPTVGTGATPAPSAPAPPPMSHPPRSPQP